MNYTFVKALYEHKQHTRVPSAATAVGLLTEQAQVPVLAQGYAWCIVHLPAA